MLSTSILTTTVGYMRHDKKAHVDLPEDQEIVRVRFSV